MRNKYAPYLEVGQKGYIIVNNTATKDVVICCEHDPAVKTHRCNYCYFQTTCSARNARCNPFTRDDDKYVFFVQR